jgi:hypothetical protein
VNYSSFLGQKKNSPQHVPCGVTAVAAVLEAGPELCPKFQNAKKCKSGKKVPKRKIIQVLLDSGSDGDLMFHKKDHTKAITP